MTRGAAILIAAAWLTTACQTSSPGERVSAEAVRVDQVAAEPRIVGESTREVEFRYRTSRTVSSRVVVEDPLGRRVAELEAAPSSEAVRVRWSVGDVRDGVHVFRIETWTDNGWRRATKPPGPRKEVLAQRFQFDREKLAASFILPEPAYVTLRVGSPAVPLLRTLMDWTPMGPGAHQVEWDGLDSSGTIRVGKNPEVYVGMRAFSLPENALIVEGRGRRAASAAEEPDRRTDLPCMLTARSVLSCHAPGFDIDFVGASPTDSGTPAIRGRATVRVSVDPADRAILLRSRFEVMFFIDSVFLFEEEQATDPLNYTLDVSDLPPGEHLLTVNVLSYDDRVSVRSVPFVVLPGGV